MAIWDDLEAKVRAQGARVDERLRLLALLRDAEPGEDAVGEESTALLQAIQDAAKLVKSEIS